MVEEQRPCFILCGEMEPVKAPAPRSDTQATAPTTQISLSRVGVSGVEKVIRVSLNGKESTYHALLECVVDLNPRQKGVHMSRFEEIVNEAIDSVVLGEALRAEELAAHIAEQVRERQDGLRAEVTIDARYPETVPAPASGIDTQEIYTLLGTAVASEGGTRTVAGVEAQGMTACPCAQGMVEEAARERLATKGFSADQIDEVVESVPIATHNQRGEGRLLVGLPEGSGIEIDARELLRIVEGSMSSEIYELMKRADELAVVERAHANPMFVEDCVREMVRQLLERKPDLPGDAFVSARQENFETIHRHNVVAERHGTVAEIKAELDEGDQVRAHTDMRTWLDSAG